MLGQVVKPGAAELEMSSLVVDEAAGPERLDDRGGLTQPLEPLLKPGQRWIA
jgi:hypothetical protein